MSPTPLFGWHLAPTATDTRAAKQDIASPAATDRGQAVVAWQVQIRRVTPAAGAGDWTLSVLDTGRVEGGAHAHVDVLAVAAPEASVVAAAALAPSTQYTWRCRVWAIRAEQATSDPRARPVVGPWSDEATFVTAPAWQPQWVTAPGGLGADTGTDLMRATFSLPPSVARTSAVASATLSVCGLGVADVFMNGARVGPEAAFLEPAWSHYNHTCYYSTHNVTAALRVAYGAPGGAAGTLGATVATAGSHAVGVRLGNGFYNIPSSDRYTKFTGTFGPRVLALQIDVVMDDGTRVRLSAQPARPIDHVESLEDSQHAHTGVVAVPLQWRAARGPTTFASIYGGEDHNATLPPGPGLEWTMPGYNRTVSGDWLPAAASPGPRCRAQLPQTVPPVQVRQTLPVVNITQPMGPRSGIPVYVYDFGAIFAGVPRITLNGTRGTVVRMTPGELLDDTGLVTQASSGGPAYWEYVLSGNGPETWSPWASYYGFRWLQVYGAAPRQPAHAAPQVHETAARADGAISVVTATYGGNCNASLQGNQAANLAVACDGKSASTGCDYYVDAKIIGDPAPNCAKDYVAVFNCGADASGGNRTAYLLPEASGHTLSLSCDGPPQRPSATVVSLEGLFAYSSTREVGTFTSSNATFNAVHNITLQAIRANLYSILTDCPHREKLGWLEVAHLMASSIAYSYDLSTLYPKVVRDIQDSALPSGLVPSIAPEYVVFQGGFRDSPEWGSSVVLLPWFLRQRYGDTATLASAYDAAIAYVRYLLTKLTPSGTLAYGLGDWLDAGNGHLTPLGVTATATLVQAASAMSQWAAELGHASDASAMASAAAAAAKAYNAAWFNATDGGYATGSPSQTADGMAVALNITAAPTAAGGDQGHVASRASALAHLRARVTGPDSGHDTAGDVGNTYVLTALGDGGMSDVVADAVAQPSSPSYAHQLSLGATGLCETWDCAPGDSHIHAMLGHVEAWFYEHVGGLTVTADLVTVRPSLATLAGGQTAVGAAPRSVMHAAVTHASPPHGTFAVSWRVDDSLRRCELNVTVPHLAHPRSSPSGQRSVDAPGLRVFVPCGDGASAHEVRESGAVVPVSEQQQQQQQQQRQRAGGAASAMVRAACGKELAGFSMVELARHGGGDYSFVSRLL